MSGHTLTLNDGWDISVDAAGNITHVSGDYAIAQNAANAVRLFTDDAFFDADKGIPHLDIELGHAPKEQEAELASEIRSAVLAVDGVEDAAVTLEYDREARCFGGEITLETENGTTVSVEL